MKRETCHNIEAAWTRLGAMFNTKAAGRTPDLERLLLETARAAPGNTRLFIMAATWLAEYPQYVAGQRLARLIRDEMETEHLATMGYLLEWARQNSSTRRVGRFNRAIAACSSMAANTSAATPLASVDRDNSGFARMARESASALSRKWGRWHDDFQKKLDATRPLEWVAAKNPDLCKRATLSAAEASLLAELQSRGRIESEVAAARCSGISRPAARKAIATLRGAGLIRQDQRGKSHGIALR
jgi:hypothetical protein